MNPIDQYDKDQKRANVAIRAAYQALYFGRNLKLRLKKSYEQGMEEHELEHIIDIWGTKLKLLQGAPIDKRLKDKANADYAGIQDDLGRLIKKFRFEQMGVGLHKYSEKNTCHFCREDKSKCDC